MSLYWLGCAAVAAHLAGDTCSHIRVFSQLSKPRTNRCYLYRALAPQLAQEQCTKTASVSMPCHLPLIQCGMLLV